MFKWLGGLGHRLGGIITTGRKGKGKGEEGAKAEGEGNGNGNGNGIFSDVKESYQYILARQNKNENQFSGLDSFTGEIVQP